MPTSMLPPPIRRNDDLRVLIQQRLRGFEVRSHAYDVAHHAAVAIALIDDGAGAGAALVPNPAEVASVHRIPVDELLRADAPMLEDLPENAHPVLRMPIGNSWIAAPTAALLYQFRELCLLGRPTRVAHFEQP